MIRVWRYISTGFTRPIPAAVTHCSTIWNAWKSYADRNVDVSGNNLINAPGKSGHIGAQYTFGLGDLGELTARIQGYFTDDIYLRALNLEPFDVQDGYSIWDAKLTWDSANGNWWAQAFINNFTDETVVNNLEVTDPGIYFANINNPKLWGVIVGYRF